MSYQLEHPICIEKLGWSRDGDVDEAGLAGETVRHLGTEQKHFWYRGVAGQVGRLERHGKVH